MSPHLAGAAPQAPVDARRVWHGPVGLQRLQLQHRAHVPCFAPALAGMLSHASPAVSSFAAFAVFSTERAAKRRVCSARGAQPPGHSHFSLFVVSRAQDLSFAPKGVTAYFPRPPPQPPVPVPSQLTQLQAQQQQRAGSPGMPSQVGYSQAQQQAQAQAAQNAALRQQAQAVTAAMQRQQAAAAAAQQQQGQLQGQLPVGSPPPPGQRFSGLSARCPPTTCNPRRLLSPPKSEASPALDLHSKPRAALRKRFC